MTDPLQRRKQKIWDSFLVWLGLLSCRERNRIELCSRPCDVPVEHHDSTESLVSAWPEGKKWQVADALQRRAWQKLLDTWTACDHRWTLRKHVADMAVCDRLLSEEHPVRKYCVFKVLNQFICLNKCLCSPAGLSPALVVTQHSFNNCYFKRKCAIVSGWVLLGIPQREGHI